MYGHKRDCHWALSRRGFSLVELLVVIALVLVLIGLTAGVLGKLKNRNARQQTLLTMQAAMDVASVFNGETSTDVNHLSQQAIPYNWLQSKTFTDGSSGSDVITGSGPDVQSRAANAFIERFVWANYQMPKTRSMLVTLKASDALIDTDGDHFLEIVDGWNRPLAYAAFALPHGTGPGYDDFTDDDFLPSYARRFFTSAGADGRFGDAATSAEPVGERADNIYGFDLDAEVTR